MEFPTERSYCEISKEMSLVYFVLDVFCQFEARVPEFYAVFSVQSTLYRSSMLEQLLWAEILDFKRNLEISANSIFMNQQFLDGRHIAGFQNPQTMMIPFCWSFPSSVSRQMYVNKIEKILLNNRDLSASENMN